MNENLCREKKNESLQISDLENVRTGEKKKTPLKTLALAIYRLRVLIILHKSPKHLFNYTEELSMSNCT